MIVFTTTPNRVFAEVPPLSKGELDNAAALIVTGIVTDVKVGTAKARPDGNEYAYDLTVQVEKVEKGNLELGATLVARGFYVKLKSGYVGSTGHRCGNTDDRINAIGPGSELIHLWAPTASWPQTALDRWVRRSRCAFARGRLLVATPTQLNITDIIGRCPTTLRFFRGLRCVR
jgi:hypothetical protein